MSQGHTSRRAALLALCLLSACAASDPPGPAGPAAQPVAGASGKILVAEFALGRQDTQTAATDFLAALAANPDDTGLREEAFTAAVLAGRSEALEIARGLPANPAAILLLGDAAAKSGDWRGAAREYATLPGQGASQLMRPLLVAWALQGAGDTQGALTTLQPYLQGTRARGVFALHSAMIADTAGRNALAAQLYPEAVADYGTLNLRLGLLTANWQSRAGQAAEARGTIRATVRSNPDLTICEPALLQDVAARAAPTAAEGVAETYLAVAASLQRQDAPDFARMLLRLAIEMRPHFTSARLLAAEIEAASGQFAPASALLQEVPADDPLAALAQLRLAQYAGREGDQATAERILEALAERYPDRPEPLTLLARMQRDAGHDHRAAVTYGRAIAQLKQPGPDDWPLFYEQGVAYDHAHEWPAAEADFLRALILQPDQPFVLNYLGYAWTEQGRHVTEARQMIERAVEQRPNDGSIVDSLGWVLLQQGDAAGAVHYLERAVELQPEDATINGHLGDAYMAAGRPTEAEVQWRRALILHPDPQDEAALTAKLAALSGAHPEAQPGAGIVAHRVE